MEINYIDINGEYLGKTTYSDFHEILFPSFSDDYKNHLILKFINNENYYWKILECNINLNTINLTIESVQNPPKSIGKVAKFNNSKPKKLLTDFSLVEVEFGFFSSVLDIDNVKRPNNIYSNALLDGEIHKKRPCIVLKAFENAVQVIPLTSKATRINQNICTPIDMSKIIGISQHYHIATYALIEMIQTVSYDRVFPPRGNDGKFHQRSYPISIDDKNRLKTALSSLYNAGIQIKVDNLEKNVEKLSREKFRILDKNAEILLEKNKLEDYVMKIGKELGLGDDIITIMNHFNN